MKHFRHLKFFYFRKINKVYKQQNVYVPFMDVVPQLREPIESEPVGLHVIFNRKTENVPADRWSFLMTKVKGLFEIIPSCTAQGTVEILPIYHMISVKRRKTVGYVNSYDICESHGFMKNYFCDRIFICYSLLERNNNKRTTAGGERQILYNNVERKKFLGKNNCATEGR